MRAWRVMGGPPVVARSLTRTASSAFVVGSTSADTNDREDRGLVHRHSLPRRRARHLPRRARRERLPGARAALVPLRGGSRHDRRGGARRSGPSVARPHPGRFRGQGGRARPGDREVRVVRRGRGGGRGGAVTGGEQRGRHGEDRPGVRRPGRRPAHHAGANRTHAPGGRLVHRTLRARRRRGHARNHERRCVVESPACPRASRGSCWRARLFTRRRSGAESPSIESLRPLHRVRGCSPSGQERAGSTPRRRGRRKVSLQPASRPALGARPAAPPPEANPVAVDGSIKERVKLRLDRPRTSARGTSCRRHGPSGRDRPDGPQTAARVARDVTLQAVRRGIEALADLHGRKSPGPPVGGIPPGARGEGLPRGRGGRAARPTPRVYFIDVRGLEALPGGGSASDFEPSTDPRTRSAMRFEESVYESARDRGPGR